MFSNVKTGAQVMGKHDLDIMYANCVASSQVMGKHDLDIMYSNVKTSSQVMEGHDLDIMYGNVKANSQVMDKPDTDICAVDKKSNTDIAHGNIEAKFCAVEGHNSSVENGNGNVQPCAVVKPNTDVAQGSKCTPNKPVTHGNGGEKPCVLYLHGGGWCAYDKRVFRSTCKRLCSCGTVVFNCNFRLAPKFSVEDMQQDIYAIINYISAHARKYGGDPEKIILAGDSAGAHLLSLFINKATLAGEDVAQKVKGCAFFYGVYNLETALDTGFKHVNTYLSSIVPPSTADYHGRLQEISPVNYMSAKIPPTLICSGQIDKLNNSQSQQYVQLLQENGVEVKSLIFPKEVTAAKHKFITFDTNPAAKQSFAAFARFVRTL